jgi:alginate O-acetyltransferase complex protein AlgI
MLFAFKYMDFFAENWNLLGSYLAAHGSQVRLPVFHPPPLILPLGISFSTFQTSAYAIDVYRGQVKPEKHFFSLVAFLRMFPQLIAGPIVRYIDIANEINDRKHTIDDFTKGITRFVIGLGKKAIIANTMAEVVDSVWNAGVTNNTVAIAWIGSIAYSLQIFYDFSGYSDMAIGIGRIFGFHFIENFNRPYISKSITEFWRRWHISLSTWFRDYVYIPLGGNRRHLYRNLSIVFLLTGLWHGASWHFVLWGIWNGLFMVIERRFRKKPADKNSNAGNGAVATGKSSAGSSGLALKILGHIYALFVINLGWVLFRADNFSLALKYIGTMFGVGISQTPGFTIMWYLNNWVIFVFILAVLDIAGGFMGLRKAVENSLNPALCKVAKIVVVYGILILSIMRVMSGTYNPFIYFQF